MLERVIIENYKCLVDFDLRLQETTLLLGGNGAGKTAILDVMYGLRKLLAGEVKVTDPVAFPSSTLTRWQTHQHQVFRLQTRVGDESFHYFLRVEHAADIEDARVARETLLGEDGTVLFDYALARSGCSAMMAPPVRYTERTGMNPLWRESFRSRPIRGSRPS